MCEYPGAWIVSYGAHLQTRAQYLRTRRMTALVSFYFSIYSLLFSPCMPQALCHEFAKRLAPLHFPRTNKWQFQTLVSDMHSFCFGK